MDCLFCDLERDPIIENDYAVAVYDSYPVSAGHALVIPKRHATTIFDLSEDEYTGCFELVKSLKFVLQEKHSTSAFNIGANCGEVAGQTIQHAHIHVIPRYEGDVDDPRGGVRHVIPSKAYY